MSSNPPEICILNSGPGAWAFEPLARDLSLSLGVPISKYPGRFSYLLNCEPLSELGDSELGGAIDTFIPLSAVRIAADKRLVTQAFQGHKVAMPQTLVLLEYAHVLQHVEQHPETEWCLKFPVGCGASGHRLVTKDTPEPARWPRPWILQEFIRLEEPEVYRTFGAGGNLFGWVARRFAEGSTPSPWVSHARGARYAIEGEPPADASFVARRALEAVGLSASFGCVDLIRSPSGEWLALEVGTDGVFNHVDRDLGNEEFEMELAQRVADAFWQRAPLPIHAS